MNKFEYNKLTPFKWFVLENFPFIEEDFDALTEWQLFCKLGKEINTIIDSQNIVGTQMENVTNAFIELQNYVNNYFNNLDVQEEINNKLNDLVLDGTLTNIISNYLNPYIEEQNTRIDNINRKVNSVASGSPTLVNNISEMKDTTKTYVLSSDGKWYYYNGSSWVAGGIYQATQIADNSIFVNKFEEALQNCYKGQFEKITPTWIAGGFYNTGGNISSDENYLHTSKIPVLPNEKYIFIGTSNQSPIVLFDENENFVSYISNTNIYQLVTIPENVRYMGLSIIAGTTVIPIRAYYKLNNYIINGQGQINYGDMDEAFRNSFICNYSPITNLTWETGFFNINKPNYYETSEGFHRTQLLVTPGERYRISGSVLGNVSLIQLIGNGNPILYPSAFSTETLQIRDYELTIPEGYYILNVSGYKDKYVANKIEKVSGYSFIGISNISDYDIEQLQNFNINEQLKNDFKWSNEISNGKYAVFTFDDSNTDISTILALFKSKNVPVCFATIPSKLNNICADGRTVKAVLHDCEEHGGEVLAHWGSPLTSASSDEEYMSVYKGAKETLQNEGFTVNGIITAGGSNYNTQDFVKDVKIARNNYFYADLTATGITPVIEQYFNRRNFLDYGFNDIKTLIDNYISGTGTQPYSKWLNFASHGTKDTSLQDIETIIDYCLSNNIQIVTWNYLYNTFKSSQLEERIKALEN